MKRHLLLAAASLTLIACSPEAPAPAAVPAPVAEAKPALPPEKDPLMSAVGIGVSDLEKSAKFYTEVMGMQKVRTYELDYMNEILLRYPEGESYLVLMHWIDGSKRNYKDNPIKIVTRTKDPAALQAKIKAAGGEITREYAPSAQVGGNAVGLAKDPDGYVLELLPLRSMATAPAAAPAEAPKPN
jgi:lactoylglutathione lyase